MKNRLVTLTTTYVIIILLVISVMAKVTEDKEPPVITFTQDAIVYYEGDDPEPLLYDVVAEDKVDGDVTDTLIIESIQQLSNPGLANVIYAAKDRKNNIVKVGRVIQYVAAESVEASNNDMESDKESEEPDQSEPTKIPTVTEDDTITNEDTDISPVGYGSDTEQGSIEDMPVISTGVPIIILNKHEITIKVGESFNPMNYIEVAVDDKDDAWRRISIDGKYSTKKPGEYTLEYSVRDSDGNKSNIETLILKVTE